MTLATLIVHYNLGEDTLKCVESLRRQTPGPILIVDNGSRQAEFDRLAEGLKNFSDTTVIRNASNTGFCDGVNLAFTRLMQDVDPSSGITDILILNPDVILEAGFVEALAEARLSYPSDILGGAMFSAAGQPLFQGSLAPHLFFMRGRLKLHDSPYAVAFAEGSSLVIPLPLAQKRFDLFGFIFDPQFFIYWEDCDLCLWARSLGYTSRIVPQARGLHALSKTTGQTSPFKTYYMTRNFVGIAGRYLSRSLWTFFLFYFPARTLIDILLRDRRAFHRAQARWRGLYDGFARVKGPREDYSL